MVDGRSRARWASKDFSAYSDDDWRSASASLRQILTNGWPVYADCDLCDLRNSALQRRGADGE